MILSSLLSPCAVVSCMILSSPPYPCAVIPVCFFLPYFLLVLLFPVLSFLSQSFSSGTKGPCTLGYNDFHNLVMQTLCWLPYKVLSHIHKKKIFCFFEPFPAHLQSNGTKSANKSKKNFITKFNMVSKNAEFHADFESVEKVFFT
jgi:hypothetical protein